MTVLLFQVDGCSKVFAGDSVTDKTIPRNAVHRQGRHFPVKVLKIQAAQRLKQVRLVLVSTRNVSFKHYI